MRLPVTLVIALVCSACAVQPPQRPPEAAARDVLESYRIPAMLDKAAPMVSGSMYSNLPAKVGASERKRLRKAINQVFDVQSLQQGMVDSLVGQARRAQRIEALHLGAEALNTELAQRMVALEGGVGEEDFAAGYGDFRSSLTEAPSDRRMDQAKQLARSLQLVNLQSAFNAGVLRGMVRARNAAASEKVQTSDESLQRMLDQTRRRIAGRVSERLPTMLYYVYRNVPEADMTAYAEMQSGAEMRWLNGAVANAMAESLAEAARKVGKRYASMARSADEDGQEAPGEGVSDDNGATNDDAG